MLLAVRGPADQGLDGRTLVAAWLVVDAKLETHVITSLGVFRRRIGSVAVSVQAGVEFAADHGGQAQQP